MIESIKNLLNQVAVQNGHANWQVAEHRLDQKSLHELYVKVIHAASGRAFNKGWNERASHVSYSKKSLGEVHTKEHTYMRQKLDEI